ncbi:hypothetical protein [Halpernia frigidisoli]|uniref:hypothetical protein n=1 Tax=Halpernia frigidisoli TaxID=1125876 RepID=UPI0011604F26|nr:hypothetical protein [Halpernia frigidisoli]
MISYLLTLMITLASFQSLFFVIDYNINQDYYEALCVNKDKPEMLCNGKCEMRKEANQSNSNQKTFKTGFDFTLTFQKVERFVFKTQSLFQEKNRAFSHWNADLQTGYLTLKPYPPQTFI